MRRFLAGLLVGIVAGWVAAWWWLGQADRRGPIVSEQEPMRIALPDLPWGEKEEGEVPAAEPVVTDEVAEPVEKTAEDALARAREAIDISEPLMAYCARCRTKRPMQDPEPAVTKDGRPAARGTCPECDANMFRFVSA